MKLHLLAFVLLLAAVPVWADEEPAPAAASPEPSIVEATGCVTFYVEPVTPVEVVSTPFLGASETMTATLIPVCVGCRELTPKCTSPGQDAGKPCGDGDPPNTCTCKWCDHTFGCFP